MTAHIVQARPGCHATSDAHSRRSARPARPRHPGVVALRSNAGQARSPGSGCYQVGAHDPSLAGRHRCGHAHDGWRRCSWPERVAPISAPGRKRAPVLYEDGPGDANGVAARAKAARFPRGPCPWRSVVRFRSRRSAILAGDLPADAVPPAKTQAAPDCCRLTGQWLGLSCPSRPRSHSQLPGIKNVPS